MLALSSKSPRNIWSSWVVLALLLSAPASLAAAEYEFPADYPPTNEIRIENRVAVPMRDGVVLFADVYRPVERRQVPRDRLTYALLHRARAEFLQRRRLLRAARLRVRLSRRARSPRVRGPLGTVSRRHRRRLRHRRVGRGAALVQRQGRHVRRLVSRTGAMARRPGQAAAPDRDLSARRLHEHLPRLDHGQRRLAAGVQLRLGPGAPGIAHHAEHRHAHHGRGAAEHQLRRGGVASAAQHHAGARRPQRAVLPRLDCAPQLRRLLEEGARSRSTLARSTSPSILWAAFSTSSPRAPSAATWA